MELKIEKTKLNQETDLLNDIEFEEIAKRVKKRCTSGFLNNGKEGINTYWELKVIAWEEDQ